MAISIFQILLMTLSIGGLFISFYFLCAKKGWCPKFVKNMPLCDGNTCMRVSDSRYGNMFGVPNYISGFIYYVIILAFSLFNFDKNVLYVLLIVSWSTVLLAVYLTYALLVKLKTVCVPCLISHGINLGIAVVISNYFL
ncbi:vitamin K epoxide reductase family protein [Candidatus Woesearchaeota archaeon]|nr:vitamin K epoxide reductase family protein [Candidatus Woesearchaeota archaeon]